MNLKEQQYICTAAECGSITKAAEKLFITQPALSLYISNLEKVLGIRLFDRIGKQLLLTPAGEIVFNEVNTIPGFTAHSRYPKMMEAAGVDFSALITRIIQVGLGR